MHSSPIIVNVVITINAIIIIIIIIIIIMIFFIIIIIMTIIVSTITITIIRFLNQPVCFRSRHIRNQNSMMPFTSGCGQRTTQGGFNRGAMFLASFDNIAMNARSHRSEPCVLGPPAILTTTAIIIVVTTIITIVITTIVIIITITIITTIIGLSP